MDIIKTLQETLGADQVITGEEISRRATSYWDQAPTTALALLKPRNTEEVSAALKVCHAHKQPVVTQGGLSGCVEGAVAAENEVIISLEKMNRIESIDPQDGVAFVEAGVILEVLQEKVQEHELIFPLDLGARGSCTIGGNVATNAGGINVLRYGMMRNLVLGLEAVLADGTVISSMNQMLKNNAGYDLKQLFIGSEGTLGLVTRAVVKLFPQPLSCSSAMVAMESFDSVSSFLVTLQRELAGTLSAYEVMWAEYYNAVTGDNGLRAPMNPDYPFYVMIEAEGADPNGDNERFESILEAALIDGTIIDAVLPKSEAERRALWQVREDFESLLPAYLYDVSLPIREMDAYIKQVIANVAEKWPNGGCYPLGHIADGNLHLFVQPGAEGDFHADSDSLVYEPLAGLNGSVSAEHGIGTEKIAWLGHSRNDNEIALMQGLKTSLDPDNILNPGRVLGSKSG